MAGPLGYLSLKRTTRSRPSPVPPPSMVVAYPARGRVCLPFFLVCRPLAVSLRRGQSLHQPLDAMARLLLGGVATHAHGDGRHQEKRQANPPAAAETGAAESSWPFPPGCTGECYRRHNPDIADHELMTEEAVADFYLNYGGECRCSEETAVEQEAAPTTGAADPADTDPLVAPPSNIFPNKHNNKHNNKRSY